MNGIVVSHAPKYNPSYVDVNNLGVCPAHNSGYNIAPMSTFAERVRIARDAAGLTQEQLAELVGVSQPGIRKLERGALSSRHLVKIAIACRVRPEWLQSGEGEMEADRHPLRSPDGAHPISLYHPEEALAEGEFAVPAVNLRVGAGSRIVADPVEIEGMKRYSSEWAIKYGLKPDRLIRYQVRGESMDPVIKDGAWILVEMGDFPIQDGMPYLIRGGEDVQVKFLFKRPDGGVIIRSHNPASPDVILTAAERGSMDVLGRVVESVQMWIKPSGRKVG